MSTVVETYEDNKPSFTSRKLFRVIAGVVSFLTDAMKVVTILCIIGIVYCLAQSYTAGLFSFVEFTILSVAYWIILGQLNAMLSDMKTQGGAFMSQQAKRLRIIGIVLIVLMLVGFAFSLAQTLIAYGGQSFTFGISFSLGFDLFPPSDGWHELYDATFDASGYSSGSAVSLGVTIDVGPLFVAALLWVLSLVFEYGAWLQSESDMTV